MVTSFALLLLATSIVFVAGAAFLMLHSVSRPRVQAFARRQHLLITPANGPMVLQALALTRWWRTVGLFVGLALGAIPAIPQGKLGANFMAMFLGWFAGAVIAEWRLLGPDGSGPRRSASLNSRELSAYLPRPLLIVVGVVSAMVVLDALIALARQISRHTNVIPTLGWVGMVVLTLAVLGLTARRILQRPQPVGLADVMAADDALRSRSLRVIVGSTVAALGWFISVLVEPFHTRPNLGGVVIGATALVGLAIALWVAPAPAEVIPSEVEQVGS